MRLTDQVSTLGGRLQDLETKLNRFETKVDQRFAKVDERFAKVDERFDKVDKRFDKIDEQFVTSGRRFEILVEAIRSDFRNLYDLVFAHMQETGGRLTERETEHRALEHRVTALEARRKS